MAKALTKPQPTSSVNRFLKDAAFDAALDPVETAEGELLQPEIPPQRSIPRMPVTDERIAGTIPPRRAPGRESQPISTIEIVLNPEMDELINGLLAGIRQSSGANLNKSQLFRSLLRAVKHATRGIEKEVSLMRPLKRPSNNKGFEDQRELFEETIAQVFMRGMRG